MIGLTFFFTTTIFIIITWIMFFYGIITKYEKIRKSTIYGFLAVSYIAHALACEIISLTYLFYFTFSIIFLVIFSINKRLENKENNINKKEKDSDEL